MPARDIGKPVDDESSEHSPNGCCCFLCVPIGIHSASDAGWKRIPQIAKMIQSLGVKLFRNYKIEKKKFLNLYEMEQKEMSVQ